MGKLKNGSIKNLGRLPNNIPNNNDIIKEAILLQGEDFHSALGLPVGNIELMTALLRQEGYKTTGINWYNLDVDSFKKAIDKRIETIKKVDNPRTLIYYSGHGNIPKKEKQGLLINKGFDVLEPRQFYQMINKITGKKAILLDCCYAGYFTDFIKENNNELSDYVVIAACPDGKITGNAQRGHNGWIGNFTFGFFQMLDENKGNQIDLSTVDIKSGTKLDRIVHSLLLKKNISYEVERISDTPYLL